MAITAERSAITHRPASVVASAVLLALLAVTATAGGIALVLGLGAPSQDWLDDIPLVDTWVVPGLVLGIGFGLGSALALYGVIRRPRWPWLEWLERLTGHHWSWAATIGIGAGHAVWIGLELLYLPEVSVLQLVYGPLGIALIVLPLTPAMREHLRIND